MPLKFRALLVMCFVANSLSASVIASGGFIHVTFLGDGAAHFGGPDFHVDGYFDNEPGSLGLGVVTGSDIVPNFIAGNPIGTLEYLGESYVLPNPFSDSTGTLVFFTLSGTPVPINPLGGLSFGSFTARGVIRQGDIPYGPLNFEDTFTGSGIVTVNTAVFYLPEGSLGFYVTEVTYTFTPEPASWLMVACASAVFGLFRRLRG